MKLRRADVENLRTELTGGDVVELGEVKEELVFEDDAGTAEEAGMATEEIADVETILDDPLEAAAEPVGEATGEIEIVEEEAVTERKRTTTTARRAAAVAAP